MSLNKIFNVSQRGTGTVDENGFVTVQKIYYYDLVAAPGFTGSTLSNLDKMLREEARQELLKSRREKIEKLNNL